MLKIKQFIYIIILSLTTFMSAYAKPALNIQRWSTTTGSKVYFVKSSSAPMLDIQVTFNAGSSRDGKLFGLANFTSIMLNEGTQKHSANEIADLFDALGTQFSANTNADMTIVNLRTLTQEKYLAPALNMFIEVLSKPTFPISDFRRSQQQLLSTVQLRKQKPGHVASDKFLATVFNDHPYGHPVIGFDKTIKTIKANDLKAFHRHYYVAKNALITIVGDISTEKAKKISESISQKLKPGQSPKKIKNPLALLKSKTIKIHFPSTQANILIGKIGIDRLDSDYFSLNVGNYTLGGSSLTSELFQEVRNKRGLAYSIGSNLEALKTSGFFYIGLQTKNSSVQEALKIARKTLKHFVQYGPSKAQLITAKQNIIGRFPLGLASNAQILSQLTTIGFYGLPIDYLDTYCNKIKHVTRKQIQNAFKRHIQLNKMVTIIVGK